MQTRPVAATISPLLRGGAPGEPDAYGTWTAERLEQWLRSSSVREPVIVLAHRAPGTRRGGNGPATAVEPLIRACSGVWISASESMSDVDATAGDAFRVEGLPIGVEEHASYAAFAQEALWPLCHRAHVKPTFRADDFTTYWRVNAQFADAVDRQATDDSPLVFVQDHHLALAPLLIRERRPSSRIVTFWHIPWPDWQAFEICPWSQHLLEGLLGSSILGFQTPIDCRNFIETV